MTECPICFKKANYTTECNHHFCKKCLYRWGETCPLCRAFVMLKYPKTRSMSLRQHVINNAGILLDDIHRVEGTKYKIKLVTKLLQFLWDHRVYVRKMPGLCKTIWEKSADTKKACIILGIVPPNIIKKTLRF